MLPVPAEVNFAPGSATDAKGNMPMLALCTSQTYCKKHHQTKSLNTENAFDAVILRPMFAIRQWVCSLYWKKISAKVADDGKNASPPGRNEFYVTERSFVFLLVSSTVTSNHAMDGIPSFGSVGRDTEGSKQTERNPTSTTTTDGFPTVV